MKRKLGLVMGLLWFVVACVDPRVVKRTLEDAEDVLVEANRVHARLCAPEPMANAESHVGFTRVEFKQGYVRRAGEHADFALEEARRAVELATPCGTADRDGDTIVDIIDQCPDEPEDFDGVEDEDGCRDIDPNGDEDGDSIVNIDDDCIFEPEDFDGHADEDGCPETSDDTDGDGYIDVKDKCPEDAEDFDGFQDDDGCPEPDNDEDTIMDIHDSCPLIPEDLDDWEDDDGCPDPDNDLDGIPDVHDKCPNEPGPRDNEGCPVLDRDGDGIADVNDKCPDDPETYNKYLDQDGCPDTPPAQVKVTRKMIEIKEQIKFDVNKATIRSESFTVLNDVYTVLVDSPAMTLSIEGHTDSDGSDDYNLQLSKDRAASCLQYLVKKGVDSSRLVSEGFGETKPIDTNRTPEGKQNNRRVEFVITSQ